MRRILDKNAKPSRYSTPSLNPGLKQIHIGEDVYVYGRQKEVKGKGLHMVIYGPNRKEYHVWDKEVTNLTTAKDSDHYNDWWYCNRDGNRAIQHKVKVYVLTNILDEKKNWCFDLSKIPNTGHLKVIYDNGTVKNIDFDGTFNEVEVRSRKHSLRKTIKPIGYRIN